MSDLDKWLNIAKSAALSGGQYLAENQENDLEVLLDSGRDIKLQIDTDTEKLIINKINAHSSFSILGEETGLSN